MNARIYLFFALIFVTGSPLSAHALPHRGGGGFGNIIRISGNVYAATDASDNLEWHGDDLVDLAAHEKILHRRPLANPPLKNGVNAYSTQLGDVKATEFAARGPGQPNAWIVCSPTFTTPGEAPCTELTSLSRTNMKLPAVLGSLTHQAPNPK